MLLYWDTKHLWASQWWKRVRISAIMLLTNGNYTKEKGSLASDGFSHLDELSFVKCCIKKLVSLSVPQLLGWKELPTETALISAYFKLFGQELAYININKEVLQQAVKVPGPPPLLCNAGKNVTLPYPKLLDVCFPAECCGAR